MPIRGHIWHKYLRFFWYRLWIGPDECDRLLDMDGLAILVMTEEEKFNCLQDLYRRRTIAGRLNADINHDFNLVLNDLASEKTKDASIKERARLMMSDIYSKKREIL